MRLRRRSFLGKVAIGIISVILVLMLIRRNDAGLEYDQSPLRRFDFQRILPAPINSALNFGNRLMNVVEKCVSSIDLLRITANYTMNAVLDNLVISYRPWERPKGFVPEGAVPETEPLQVIVIPHSHNDPGWKKTYQKYFDDQTTHILSNMVDFLDKNPDMTFIWVESCFLDKWWTNQTTEIKQKFKELVESGRLEITSGMWVAPDEASPHYYALIDQLIEGHYWVKKNLGILPESSLNFDQFGYSSTMPYLAKKAGLKNILIKRIHRAVKEQFGQENKLNFHWRQFSDSHGRSDIFAHIDTYEWMSISDSCGPDRAVCRGLDFLYMPDLPDPYSPAALRSMKADHATQRSVANFHTFVTNLVEQFRLKNGNYKYRVMMLPHGGDFRYDKIDEWNRQYKNLKVFMKYVNERKEFNVNMKFGTLKDYFFEIDKQNVKYGLEYPVVSGDFYTYTENNEYWTGYFTTRMFDKKLGREVLETLRAAELFASILFRSEKINTVSDRVKDALLKNLMKARQNLGVFQHHDAITGTSQAHVAADYEQLLSSGFNSTQIVLSLAVQNLLALGNGDYLHPGIRRPAYNKLTEQVPIPVTADDTQVVLVNSLPQARKELVSISVKSKSLKLFDNFDKEVKIDIFSNSAGAYDIKFIVDFPPISVLIYRVRESLESHNGLQFQDVKENLGQSGRYVCENDLINVTFSQASGSPKEICYKITNICTSLQLDWRYYRGFGGAYTMMSAGSEGPAAKSQPVVKFIQGSYLCGVNTDYGYFSSSVTIPLLKGATGRALRVDVTSDISKTTNFVGDLAMRVDTKIKSNKIFYVDSNGFQLMGRKFRETIPFDGNVYPMSSMSVLEDELLRLVVHSAQPHGVVSRTSGIIDFMFDRLQSRPEMDMPEPVKDNKLTKTTFYIEIQSASEFERSSTQETTLPNVNSVFLNDLLQHPIYTLFTSAKFSSNRRTVSFLPNPLSCDITIANVKNLVHSQNVSDGTSVTLFKRAVGCNGNVENNFCSVSDSLTIQPALVFADGRSVQISKVTEMYLSHLMPKRVLDYGEEISLEPMDLKTFHLE